MENERHVVVEGPDGSVAIAFNEEVSPPEPQCEILIPSDVVTTIEHNKNVQIFFQIASLISLFKLVTLLRIIDVVNFIFITTSTFAVYSKEPILSSTLLLCHNVYLITVVPSIGFMHMWWDLAYFISCIILCSVAFVTMK